jgi:cysteine-rich repeat protein
MRIRRAVPLLGTAWALSACNVLVGLDDVNIEHGSGGSTGTAAPQGGGGTPGTTSQGGGATAGGSGGATGNTSSSSGEGGGAQASSSGGAQTSSAGGESAGGSASSTGGSASSTGGAGGGPGGPCGDGFVAADEQCDDGNSAGGDGCSAGCAVEPYHQCTVTGPSVCSKQETLCSDGEDNDGDDMTDFADTDCILPPYAPLVPCPTLRIYWSVNAPIAIPDSGAGVAHSAIFVADDISVTHTAVLLDVTHGRISDVDVALIPPFGSSRDVTSDNGGNGSNYAWTYFDPACSVSVTDGSAPFQGCYAPESSLPASGQAAKGVWTLELDDYSPGKAGTLEAWALVLCSP